MKTFPSHHKLAAKSRIACMAGSAVTMAFGVAAMAFGTQTPKTVTLDAPGWSLKRICASISQQIGQDVEPHGDIVNDYLIVHVKNVPWPELQKKLAWVEYGKWTQDGRTLTLQQDPLQVQARIQKNIDALALRLEATFKKNKEAESKSPFDAGQLARQLKAKADEIAKKDSSTNPDQFKQSNALMQAMQEDRSLVPYTRCLQDIIGAIPAKELAAIPSNKRVVFSNHPTSLQYAFSSEALTVLEGAIDQQAQLAKALAAVGVDLGPFQENWGFGNFSDKDIFNVSIHSFYGVGLQATLRIFDPNGNLVYTTDQQFGLAGEGISTKPAPSPEGYGTLDPEAVQDIKSLQMYNAATPSESLLAKLRNPLKYDPLDLTLEPLIQAIMPDKNVLIRDDSLMMMMSEIIQFKMGNQVPKNLFSGPIVDYIADSDSAPGWLALRDSFIYLSQDSSIPRGPYADLVQAISPDGEMAFLPAMRFAAASGENGFIGASIASTFFNPLCYGQSPLAQAQSGWDLMRLVGSMGDSQILQAESPQGMSLDVLPSGTREIFKSILLGEFNSAQVVDGRIMHSPDINSEPTYAFANSLPHAILKITEKNDTAIHYKVKFQGMATMYDQTSSVEQFASMAAMANSPGSSFDFSHLTVNPRKTYTISILFPGTKIGSQSVDFVVQAHTSATYNGWENLPPDIKQQVEDQMKKMRSNAPPNQ